MNEVTLPAIGGSHTLEELEAYARGELVVAPRREGEHGGARLVTPEEAARILRELTFGPSSQQGE